MFLSGLLGHKIYCEFFHLANEGFPQLSVEKYKMTDTVHSNSDKATECLDIGSDVEEITSSLIPATIQYKFRLK